MSEARIREILQEAASLHQSAIAFCSAAIANAADHMTEALESGRKILIFGNGGSAADSQHFAAELVGRFQATRGALAALALTTDSSILTSIANDFGYEQVFVRQIEALGRAGDVAFGITTSGRSPNVLSALGVGRRKGLKTIALVGQHTEQVALLSDVLISVPACSTARVQELHCTILHAICELLDAGLAH